MLVGYARTSTTDQAAGLEAQTRDLQAQGCERVFAEQVSSVTKRGALAEALGFLREGDTLIVTKPDRLARSTRELLDIEEGLQSRGIGLVILSMGGEKLDTAKPTSKLMLTILAAVAAWEREIMLERQREGIAKAKGEGKYRGRVPTARRQTGEAQRLRLEGLHPLVIADRLGISKASVYRLLGPQAGKIAAGEP
jgi:DNA invertase Pin-like site-specific DNA recombinase